MAEDDWEGIENEITDPEELRVMYSALDSFFQYAHVAHFNGTHLRRQSFYALPQAHWQLLASPPFNYLETLDRVDDAIESNAELARAIASAGAESFGRAGGLEAAPKHQHRQHQGVAGEAARGGGSGISASASAVLGPWAGVAKHHDIDKARSTLRQFYRDWSAEGAAEREASYGPVKRILEAERARRLARGAAATAGGGGGGGGDDSDDDEQQLTVLVPGAGLGRLVFDLCDMGYAVEGNEISYHQLLASSYVLNRTVRAGQHRIYPWIQTFSNHRTRADQFRSYAIPDVHPAGSLRNPTRPGGSMSMSAADFLCLYGQEEQGDRFDAVACVFFLDTAPNLVRYLQAIRHCLRDGGLLVNVGPLLWHFENNAPGNHGRDDDGDGEHDASNSSGIADPGSFELTEDEVLALVGRLGFEVEWEAGGGGLGEGGGGGPAVEEAPYIQDPNSMLLTVYRPSLWVARKKAGWVGEV